MPSDRCKIEEIKRSVSRGRELQAILDWHTGELSGWMHRDRCSKLQDFG